MSKRAHGIMFNPEERALSYYFIDFIISKGLPNTFYFAEATVCDLFAPNKVHYTSKIKGATTAQEMSVEELDAIGSDCENPSFIIAIIQQSIINFFGRVNILFAMGRKSEFLQRFLNHPVFNLEFHGCPSTELLQRFFLIDRVDESAYCHHHALDWPMPCSKLNSYCVKMWVVENAKKINMLNPRTRIATFKEGLSKIDPAALANSGCIQKNGTSEIFCVICELHQQEVLCINKLLEKHVHLCDSCVIAVYGDK